MWQKHVEIDSHKNLNGFNLIKIFNLTLSVFKRYPQTIHKLLLKTTINELNPISWTQLTGFFMKYDLAFLSQLFAGSIPL